MSWALWITGVPGSGKSAIARAAAAELAARGECVTILALDALRRVLTPTPTYDDAERQAVYRALVVIARTLARAGRAVIIDATAHRREWRDLARASIEDFAEVQLVCPLEVARARERVRGPGDHPRAIYAHAGQPGATVPGVDVPYEPALVPELTIDTTKDTVENSGARVAALARRLARRPSPSATDGWVLWVTGRPGSGKTSVVSDVIQRLGRQSVAAAVLEPGDFVGVIARDEKPSHLEAEISTRALVLAAKHLAEAGTAVIIDGPAPLRDGPRLAREIIDPFALVELVCPADICRTRERAVRWGLVPYPAASRPTMPPSLGLEYEPTVAPDLVVRTDALDRWATVEEVMHLVQRLAGAAHKARRPCT